MFLFLWWFKIQELCFSDRGSFSIIFSLSFPVFFSSCQMYLLFNFFWFCSDILCCLHAHMHVYLESCILYIFKGRGLVITPTPKYNKKMDSYDIQVERSLKNDYLCLLYLDAICQQPQSAEKYLVKICLSINILLSSSACSMLVCFARLLHWSSRFLLILNEFGIYQYYYVKCSIINLSFE